MGQVATNGSAGNLRKLLIATLRFGSQAGGWILIGQEDHVEPSPATQAAIQRARLDATTDVHQPNGRRIQINEVEYIARPLP